MAKGVAAASLLGKYLAGAGARGAVAVGAGDVMTVGAAIDKVAYSECIPNC